MTNKLKAINHSWINLSSLISIICFWLQNINNSSIQNIIKHIRVPLLSIVTSLHSPSLFSVSPTRQIFYSPIQNIKPRDIILTSSKNTTSFFFITSYSFCVFCDSNKMDDTYFWTKDISFKIKFVKLDSFSTESVVRQFSNSICEESSSTGADIVESTE